MNIIKKSVTAPLGFTANGLHCGIKRSKPDLSLIASSTPATCVGVYTKNSIKAAPLIVSAKNLKDNKAQAIITNSGNANCFTGDFGLIYAKRTCTLIGKLLGIKPSDVVVASTGIIGRPLPFKKIQKAAPMLAKGLSKKGEVKAAEGILTTDTTIKKIGVCIKINGKTVRIGAIAKGSGMIAPNMATMLCYVTTDCAISAKMLDLALKTAIDKSFNCITIDGCMSTNDMVVAMANGLAKNKSITKKDKNFKTFLSALEFVCLDMAKKIVYDAEGGTKFLTITVATAKTERQAKKTALAIANSILVKTAAYGSNPNWGRVAAAVGALGLNVNEKMLKIKFGSFKTKNINIHVDLNLGKAASTVYTSDLSLDYVRINGKYN